MSAFFIIETYYYVELKRLIMNKVRNVFVTALLIAVSSIGHAQVLDFEALSGSDIRYFSNYGGFTWSNFHANEVARMNGEGAYQWAPTSGGTVIVNSGGRDSSLIKTGGGLFDFGSANMMSAWNTGLQVTVTGWLNGASLYTKTITLATKVSGAEIFNFAGIDKLTFHAQGGIADTSLWGGSGTHFTMDDMNFGLTTAVPEPSTYAMMMAGLGLIGFVARRRKLG